MKNMILKLYSPIAAKIETPYENPWDSSGDYKVMTEHEKMKYKTEISEIICNNFFKNSINSDIIPNCLKNISQKIISTVISIEEKDRKLMLVLNCNICNCLRDTELDELCDCWERQIYNTNEILKNAYIPSKKHGKIYVYIWLIKGWAIEPILIPNN